LRHFRQGRVHFILGQAVNVNMVKGRVHVVQKFLGSFAMYAGGEGKEKNAILVLVRVIKCHDSPLSGNIPVGGTQAIPAPGIA
jgi:hypothetical protein